MPEHYVLMSCVWLTLSFHDTHKLSRVFSLWHPIGLLPSILPVTTKFSRHVPVKPAAVDGFFSLAYAAALPLLVLCRYFSSLSNVHDIRSILHKNQTSLTLPSNICFDVLFCSFRVIFVNNFAFGPQTDHQVTVIVSLFLSNVALSVSSVVHFQIGMVSWWWVYHRQPGLFNIVNFFLVCAAVVVDLN